MGPITGGQPTHSPLAIAQWGTQTATIGEGAHLPIFWEARGPRKIMGEPFVFEFRVAEGSHAVRIFPLILRNFFPCIATFYLRLFPAFSAFPAFFFVKFSWVHFFYPSFPRTHLPFMPAGKRVTW